MLKRHHLMAALLAAPIPAALSAQADLNDLEMAHVAVTASNIDIAYAHLALALSDNQGVRDFAETMIRDHSAVNEQVVALAQRLGVTAQDNGLSRSLLAESTRIKAEMAALDGVAFDRFYVSNEVSYHETVNTVVADAFLPNIENEEVRGAFEAALAIFRGHQAHATRLRNELAPQR